jgi:hypothetical protein
MEPIPFDSLYSGELQWHKAWQQLDAVLLRAYYLFLPHLAPLQPSKIATQMLYLYTHRDV